MSKKFILFLVEGINDKREIEAILHTSFFDKYRERYEPYFIVNGGDISSASGITVKNLQKKLNDILLNFRKNGVPFSNIKPSDIQEIVQVVDLDGTFIPMDNIIRGDNSSFYYDDNSIITSNVDGVRGRNKKKAEIINKMLEIDQVGSVPYSIYYVSCNMDHVLFNEKNLSTRNKNDYAYRFQMDCRNDSNILFQSIFKDGISAKGNYEESWDFIQKDCKSLQRYTNLNLFFGDEAKFSK